VVGIGTVEILTQEHEKKVGLEVLMAQHNASHLVQFDQKSLDRMVILKQTITSMSGKRSGNWESGF